MDKKIRDEVLSRLQTKMARKGNTIILPTKQMPFSQDAFMPLEQPQDTPFIFVDGGNASLIDAPNFCVQHIRIAAVWFNGTTCTKRLREDFYAVITATDERPTYAVDLVNTDFTCGPFDGLHQDLRKGSHPASPGQIAQLVRRLLELDLAKRIATETTTKEILVIDGELEPQTAYEQVPLNALSQSCTTVLLAGVSKSSRSRTDTGQSTLALLATHAPQGRWLYAPLQEKTPVTGFMRLHEKSDHVFRIDALQYPALKEIASALVPHAIDPLLWGYPYGLIAVDQLAKITNAEAMVEREALLSTSEEQLKPFLAALNAHDRF